MRAFGIFAIALVACGPSAPATPDSGPASCAAPGGPTGGPADAHCGGTVQPTRAASCHVMSDDTGSGGDDASMPDAGVPDCEYGPTLFGNEGDDDDCKYHFTWSASPICEGAAGVALGVEVTSLADGTPVTGGRVHIETFVTANETCDLATHHTGPNTFATLAEGPPGTYTGRAIFDQPGEWTVRFHVFEECTDVLPDSPHGHVAFHLDVP